MFRLINLIQKLVLSVFFILSEIRFQWSLGENVKRQDHFTEIDECSSDPCVNGQCVEQRGAYTCECDVGYTGEQCATDIDECGSNPCAHGDCNNTLGAWVCSCDEHFSGTVCDAALSQSGKLKQQRFTHAQISLDMYVCTGRIGNT